MSLSAINSPVTRVTSPANSSERPAPIENQAPADSVTLGAAAPPKKWTVMIHSCADNNLYSYMQEDLNESEVVGSTDQMNVVVYTDHRPEGGTAGFYKVTQNDTPDFTSPVLVNRGDRNLGDPKELSEFIQWSMKNYPAENYMLIMSDHGGAWQGGMSDDGSHGHMTLPMIEQGLKSAREATGRKLDVLGFDACLMANMEVLHQLKDEASFMVASEETEGGAGWQYNRVLSKTVLSGADAAMRARLDYTPREMAEGVVRMAQGNQGDLCTMSAVDMSKVGDLSAAVNNFGNALLATKVPNMDLARAAVDTQSFSMESDLYDFADRVGRLGKSDAALQKAADGVKSAIEQALVAEQHSAENPGAHGITVELNPQSAGVVQINNPDPGLDPSRFGGYAELKMTRENSFAKAVNKFSS